MGGGPYAIPLSGLILKYGHVRCVVVSYVGCHKVHGEARVFKVQWGKIHGTDGNCGTDEAGAGRSAERGMPKLVVHSLRAILTRTFEGFRPAQVFREGAENGARGGRAPKAAMLGHLNH